MPETSSAQARLLGRFGLSPDAEDVYLALVTRTAARDTEVAELTGHPLPQVLAALAKLATSGLVHQSDDGTFRARAPEFAFRDQLARRQRDLDDDHAHVERLADVFRRSAAARDSSEIVQVVAGRKALAAAICELQESAQYEVRSLVKPPVLALPAGDNVDLQGSRMAQGVCYRSVYQQSMLDDPTEIGLLEASLSWGERLRMAAQIPVKMMLADSQLGILPLEREPSQDPLAVLVRHPSLVVVLEALFERIWESATRVPSWPEARHKPLRADLPPGEAEAPDLPATPSEDDLRLLSLLVAGLPDRALAGHFRISHRTVERRIRRLMDQAGVSTRIQLGLHAAREGWI